MTLHIEAGYVVVDVGDGLVLEGHGGREVFVLGKSGLFGLFSQLWSGVNLAALLIALTKPVKLIFAVKRKEETQFAETNSPEASQ